MFTVALTYLARDGRREERGREGGEEGGQWKERGGRGEKE